MNIVIGIVILILAVIGITCGVVNILYNPEEYKTHDYVKDKSCMNCRHRRYCDDDRPERYCKKWKGELE